MAWWNDWRHFNQFQCVHTCLICLFFINVLISPIILGMDCRLRLSLFTPGCSLATTDTRHQDSTWTVTPDSTVTKVFFFIMSMCLGRPVSLNITTARQNSSLLTQGMMHVYHTVLWHTLLKYMHKILHYFGDCHRKTTDIPHKRRRKCIREKERTVKYITFLHMSERRDRY